MVVDQWFSMGGNFGPQGTFGKCWETILVVTTGEDATAI